MQPERCLPPLVIFPECEAVLEEEEEGAAERLEVELMCPHLLLSASETPMAPRSNRPSHTGPL